MTVLASLCMEGIPKSSMQRHRRAGNGDRQAGRVVPFFGLPAGQFRHRSIFRSASRRLPSLVKRRTVPEVLSGVDQSIVHQLRPGLAQRPIASRRWVAAPGRSARRLTGAVRRRSARVRQAERCPAHAVAPALRRGEGRSPTPRKGYRTARTALPSHGDEAARREGGTGPVHPRERCRPSSAKPACRNPTRSRWTLGKVRGTHPGYNYIAITR